MVGKKHWLVRPTACIIAISKPTMGLDKVLNRARVAHVTLPMHMWHMLVLCWHSSLGNTSKSIGLHMAGKLHGGLASHLQVIMLGIAGRNHRLASKVHLNIRLYMGGRKHWLASKLQLVIMLHISGRKHRLASKMHFKLML